MDNSTTGPEPRLHDLHCPFCGGEIPFAPTPKCACIHCGQEVPIPEAHLRAALAARHRDGENREAALLWRKVTGGGVPGPLLGAVKVLAIVAAASVLVPGLFLMAWAGDNDRHLLPFLVWFAFAEVSLLLFAVLFVRETSRNVAVSTYWASLGAAPVEGRTGVYRCRSCGGMISAGPEDVAITCTYCGRDNLVGLAPEKLRALLGRARHSTLSLGAAVQAVGFRRDERWIYVINQVLLIQLVLLPMLARGLEDALELGWVGPVVAFAVPFVGLLAFGFGVAMRRINAHLAATLKLWKDGDPSTEAFIVEGDYLLVVLGDAGALFDSPTSKAFIPADAIERARLADLQFDIDWREGSKRRHHAFNSRGNRERVGAWLTEKAGSDRVVTVDGDSVSKGRAAINAIIGLAIIGWAVGMFLL